MKSVSISGKNEYNNGIKFPKANVEILKSFKAFLL